jgi:hypothetical protein
VTCSASDRRSNTVKPMIQDHSTNSVPASKTTDNGWLPRLVGDAANAPRRDVRIAPPRPEPLSRYDPQNWVGAGGGEGTGSPSAVSAAFGRMVGVVAPGQEWCRTRASGRSRLWARNPGRRRDRGRVRPRPAAERVRGRAAVGWGGGRGGGGCGAGGRAQCAVGGAGAGGVLGVVVTDGTPPAEAQSDFLRKLRRLRGEGGRRQLQIRAALHHRGPLRYTGRRHGSAARARARGPGGGGVRAPGERGKLYNPPRYGRRL